MRPAPVGAALLGLALALACGHPAPRPRLHRVEIRAMQFVPATLEVAVGDVVEWTNDDIVPHTATAPGIFDSPPLTTGQQWRYVITRPGPLAYGCRFHPTMHASLTAH
jgi:plastocyanin